MEYWPTNPQGAGARVFQQVSLVDKLPEGHDGKAGICRGLSLAYAGLNRIEQTVGHAAGAGSGSTDEETKYSTALALYAGKIQTTILDAEDWGQGLPDEIRQNPDEDSIWLTYMVDNTRLCAKAVSLEVAEGAVNLPWPCLDAIADLSMGNPGTYYMVNFPCHVVCVHTGLDMVARVFDPNFGEAWARREHLGWLLETVFGTDQEIQDLYELRIGARVTVIPVS